MDLFHSVGIDRQGTRADRTVGWSTSSYRFNRFTHRVWKGQKISNSKKIFKHPIERFLQQCDQNRNPRLQKANHLGLICTKQNNENPWHGGGATTVTMLVWYQHTVLCRIFLHHLHRHGTFHNFRICMDILESHVRIMKPLLVTLLDLVGHSAKLSSETIHDLDHLWFFVNALENVTWDMAKWIM